MKWSKHRTQFTKFRLYVECSIERTFNSGQNKDYIRCVLYAVYYTLYNIHPIYIGCIIYYA